MSLRSLMIVIGLLAFSVGAYVRHVEAQDPRNCNVAANCYWQGYYGSCVTFNFYCQQCFSGGNYPICVIEYGTCTISGNFCQYRFCSDVCQMQ